MIYGKAQLLLGRLTLYSRRDVFDVSNPHQTVRLPTLVSSYDCSKIQNVFCEGSKMGRRMSLLLDEGVRYCD